MSFTLLLQSDTENTDDGDSTDRSTADDEIINDAEYGYGRSRASPSNMNALLPSLNPPRHSHAYAHTHAHTHTIHPVDRSQHNMAHRTVHSSQYHIPPFHIRPSDTLTTDTDQRPSYGSTNQYDSSYAPNMSRSFPMDTHSAPPFSVTAEGQLGMHKVVSRNALPYSEGYSVPSQHYKHLQHPHPSPTLPKRPQKETDQPASVFSS